MRDEFPVRIIKLRRALNMTLAEFSEHTGVYARTIYHWEEGAGRPSFDALARIYKTTGVSLDWLVAGCGTMFPTVAHT